MFLIYFIIFCFLYNYIKSQIIEIWCDLFFVMLFLNYENKIAPQTVVVTSGRVISWSVMYHVRLLVLSPDNYYRCYR